MLKKPAAVVTRSQPEQYQEKDKKYSDQPLKVIKIRKKDKASNDETPPELHNLDDAMREIYDENHTITKKDDEEDEESIDEVDPM